MGPVLVLNVVAVLALLPANGGQSGQTQPYATSRSPHGNLNIPCQNCHTVSGWKPIRAVPEFDHNRTKFPLRGMHESVSCEQCHTKPVFTNVGTRCADCHADIHRRQLGANCEQCHTVKGWQVAIQQVQQHENRFPLVGAHAALDCDSCHKGAATSQFAGLSTQCYSCHANDYQQTTVPNHVTAKFPTTCEQCHGMDTWFGVAFDHFKFTGFALTGAHSTLQCTQCHVNGNYNLTSGACVTCHLKDYQATTNPNHVQSSFPQTCDSCHTTASWLGASFNHASTGFALTGAHSTLQCSQCHINGNYRLTSGACVTCHLKDFQGTTNPNHVAGGFPQTCDACHNTTSWAGATFNHNNTPFPLTGAHTTVPCANCHVNNNYTTLPTACYGCHQKDYQGTNNPNHVSAGFPTSCQTCHNTASWLGATFNHTWFPTNHGGANGVCSTCHINPSNFAVFQCTNCHTKATTDQHHQGVSGYVYNSQNCYQCHPNGQGGG